VADQTVELLIKLRNETAAGFAQLQGSLNKTKEETTKAGQAFKDFGSGLAGGFGIGLGFLTAQKAGEAFAGAVLAIPKALLAVGAAVVQSTQKVMELGGRLTDLSAKVGISAEALQKLKFAGSLVGVGLDTITAATTKMQRALIETPEAFNRIGLSAAALRQMKPEEQLAAISDKLRGIKDPAALAAASIALLGRSGAELLPLLTSNMREVMEQAERLGIVLSNEVVAAADDLGDQVEILSATWEGLNNNIGAVIVTSEPLHRLIEGVTDILGEMSRAVHDNREGLRSFVDSAVVLAADGLVLLAKAAEVANGAWVVLKNAWAVAAAEARNLSTAVRLGADVIAGNLSITAAAAIAAGTAAENNRRLAASVKEDNAAGRERHAVLSRVTVAFQALRDKVAESVGQTHKSTKEIRDNTVELGKSGKAHTTLAEIMARNAHNMRQAGEKLYDDLDKRLDKHLKNSRDAMDAQIAMAQKEAEERARATEEIAEAQRRAHEERMAALSELSGALFNAGEEVGGFLGSLLQLGSAGVDVFLNLQNQAQTTTQRILAAANAVNAAVGAFQSGSILGGAGAGAAAGAAFGPLGAVIGGVAGGLLGLFGGAKKAREELAKLKDQVVGSFGSMEQFRKTAQNLGIDVSKAMSSKSPEEFKRAVDAVTKAMEEQKKRLDGLRTAMGGLELMTKGFAAQMERSGVATEASQAAFQRLGQFALATFAGLVRETGDVIGALQQMGGSLDALVAAQQKFGFASSATLDRLLGLRAVITQHEDLAQQIQGLNQLMTGLGEANQITRELFVAFGQDAAAQFAELQARGVDANTSMALMQPTLQSLWEGQQRFGNITDEATLALLRQAEEQGLVGDQMRSVNEQILEVLLAIGEVLGAAIPDALRRMGDEAEHQFNRMQEGANAASSSLAGISQGHVERHDTAGLPGLNFASRTGGGRTAASAAGGAGGGGAGQTLIVNNIVDGEVVSRSIMRRNRTGHFTIVKGSVR
jgi:hypothetical protein